MYACKCLNIRIHTVSPPLGSTPEIQVVDSESPRFENVYAVQDGISVAHPQLTLQDYGTSFEVVNASHHVRIITHSCLVCKFATYRVHSPIDNDNCNGGTLPKENNIPEHVGWTQVNKDALNEKSIHAAEQDARFSAIFRILVPPQDSVSLSPSFENNALKNSPPSVTSLFPGHGLFPPPPFSPKHPAFLHIATVAEQYSSVLRSGAESAIRTQLQKVQLAEEEIRRHAEIIWTAYNTHLKEVEKPSGLNDMTFGQPSQTHEAAVSVRDFLPQPVSSSKKPRSSVGHQRVSSLSASLKTSYFHPPNRDVSATTVSSDSSGTTNNILDIDLPRNSPKSISKSGPSSVLNFRRPTEDDRDIAVSYKVLLLEEERAKYIQGHGKTVAQLPSSPSRLVKDNAAPAALSQPTLPNPDSIKPSSDKKSPARKAKRAVKFDIVTKTDVESPRSKPRVSATSGVYEELVFDLEDEDGRYIEPPRPAQSSDEPPAVSNSRTARRPARSKQSNAGLPNSYVSLRPESLPSPSTMRHVRNGHSGKRSGTHDSDEDPRLKAIMELVGRDIPSHRGAWDKDGPAWQEGRKLSEPDSDEDEISESEDSDISLPHETDPSPFVVGSLPISIRSFMKRDVQGELTAASYQPSSIVAPSQSVPNTGQSNSSKSIRRAIFAERDRLRSIDPGFLHQVEEEDDDDEEVEELPELSADQKDDKGDRAKQTALRILQKQAEIPAAGMWRSLAD